MDTAATAGDAGAERRRPDRQRAPGWARALLVVGLVLTVLVAGCLAGARVLVNRWDQMVGREALLAPSATAPAEEGSGRSGDDARASLQGPLNYLVIGTDRRPETPGDSGRADAVIIVHIPAGLREAYLISIPRDLLVPIPGYGKDKINAAFAYGGGGSAGAQLLSATVNQATGVGFAGAAILDFGGFRRVIDELGGVELCGDLPSAPAHPGAERQAGCQRLTGAQALDVARQRQGLPAGDFDRGRNHQRLIKAVIDRIAESGLVTDPLRLDQTIRAIGESLTVDTGGVPLPDLVFALRQVRPDSITGITLPSYARTIDGTSYVLAEPAAAGLYRAVRDSELAAWTTAHPRWRNEG